MKVQKSFNLSAVELMDALKEELLDSCIFKGDQRGYADLTGEEERHLLDLWEVIKPLGQQIEARKDMKYVLDCIGRKEKESENKDLI